MRGISVLLVIFLISCTLPDSSVKPVVINVSIIEDESTYSVYYNLNGATTGIKPIDDNEYKQGDIISIKDGSGILKGDKPSIGWNSAPDGTGAQYDFNQYVILGSNDLELFCQF